MYSRTLTIWRARCWHCFKLSALTLSTMLCGLAYRFSALQAGSHSSPQHKPLKPSDHQPLHYRSWPSAPSLIRASAPLALRTSAAQGEPSYTWLTIIFWMLVGFVQGQILVNVFVAVLRGRGMKGSGATRAEGLRG